jgi:hypothetical protein
MKYDKVERAAFTDSESTAGGCELRRFMRHNIKAQGTLRYARARHAVTLEDLSEQGCQFRLPLQAGLPVGATVSIAVEGLSPFVATVRWYRNGWAGVEFDLPVYPPVLAHLQKTYTTDSAD